MRWHFALLLLFDVSSTLASSGDRSQVFQDCVDKCAFQDCATADAIQLELALRVTQWSCLDNCKYHCMHAITDNEITMGQQVQQYYGKWPFWRIFGMQEPASVAFSLLNLWIHVRGANRFRRDIPESHPMKSYYLIWSFTSINAWVWSSVFHTRDTPRTEKLDYFSAALTIMSALYFTVIRMFHWYPPRERAKLTLSGPSTPTKLSKRSKVWTAACVIAYVGHVSYLTLLPRFDYSYNIIFNLVIGMAHNILWVLYSLPSRVSLFARYPYQPTTYRPPFAGTAAALVLVTMAATLFEVFDFPPWARVIDAHSLWHLSTVPIAIYWYRFLIHDARDPGWRRQGL